MKKIIILAVLIGLFNQQIASAEAQLQPMKTSNNRLWIHELVLNQGGGSPLMISINVSELGSVQGRIRGCKGQELTAAESASTQFDLNGKEERDDLLAIFGNRATLASEKKVRPAPTGIFSALEIRYFYLDANDVKQFEQLLIGSPIVVVDGKMSNALSIAGTKARAILPAFCQ